MIDFGTGERIQIWTEGKDVYSAIVTGLNMMCDVTGVLDITGEFHLDPNISPKRLDFKNSTHFLDEAWVQVPCHLRLDNAGIRPQHYYDVISYLRENAIKHGDSLDDVPFENKENDMASDRMVCYVYAVNMETEDLWWAGPEVLDASPEKAKQAALLKYAGEIKGELGEDMDKIHVWIKGAGAFSKIKS